MLQDWETIKGDLTALTAHFDTSLLTEDLFQAEMGIISSTVVGTAGTVMMKTDSS